MNKTKVAVDPNLNIVVRASAGSGKTFLLTARILNLLITGHKPDSILAITFTRKAAGEMAHRVQQQLLEFTQMSDAALQRGLIKIGNVADKKSMQRARSLYEYIMRSPNPIHIETFHSFCQSLLNRFSIEAKVVPGFEIIESPGEQISQAWDALNYQASKNPDSALGQHLETMFEHCGGLTETYRILLEFVKQRSDWWAYTFNESDPVNYACDNLYHLLKLESPNLIDADFIKHHEHQLRSFVNLLAKHETKTNIKCIDHIQIALGNPDADGFDHLYLAFFKKDGSPTTRKPSKILLEKLGFDGVEELINLHEQIISAMSVSIGFKHRQKIFAVNKAWFSVGSQLLSLYQTIKQEQRGLDFADLEWKTYLLLQQSDNALWIQYKLDQRIQHILIDEFQDTNPTQ